jgi:hypothetical protein
MRVHHEFSKNRDKIREPFATAKKVVQIIPARSHFFAAKKVAT